MHNIPSLAGMLGLGGPELIVILLIMLVLFGGSKLPELAKGLGKSIKEFKRAAADDAETVPPAAGPPATPAAVPGEERPPANPNATTLASSKPAS